MRELWEKIRHFNPRIYVMPHAQKQELVTANLKSIIVTISFLAFCAILTTVLHLPRLRDNEYFFYYCFYYIGLSSVSTLTVLLAVFLKNKTKLHPMVRNIPLYLIFSGMLFLTTETFIHMPQAVNSFVIYACITIACIFFYSIEPIMYFLLLLPCSGFVAYYSYRMFGTIMVLNILLFYIIINLCALYKWRTSINDYKNKKQQDERSKTLENEIKLASYVQQSFYKKDVSNLQQYEIAYYNIPLAGVSGDLYDFYVEENRLKGLSIFDVSGHGISSGLVTMLVRNIIQQEFDNSPDVTLADIAKKIDVRFREEKGEIENFMTGILLRMRDNNIEIVNAGHQKPVIYKQSRNDLFLFDEDSNFGSSVIGLNNFDPFFSSTSFRLDSGDELVLYTDGIVEALNSEKKQFGKKRLIDSIAKATKLELDQQIPSIIQDYRNYIKDVSPVDDVSIVILRKK